MSLHRYLAIYIHSCILAYSAAASSVNAMDNVVMLKSKSLLCAAFALFNARALCNFALTLKDASWSCKTCNYYYPVCLFVLEFCLSPLRHFFFIIFPICYLFLFIYKYTCIIYLYLLLFCVGVYKLWWSFWSFAQVMYVGCCKSLLFATVFLFLVIIFIFSSSFFYFKPLRNLKRRIFAAINKYQHLRNIYKGQQEKIF